MNKLKEQREKRVVTSVAHFFRYRIYVNTCSQDAKYELLDPVYTNFNALNSIKLGKIVKRDTDPWSWGNVLK